MGEALTKRAAELITRLHVQSGDLLPTPDRQLLREIEKALYLSEDTFEYLQEAGRRVGSEGAKLALEARNVLQGARSKGEALEKLSDRIEKLQKREQEKEDDDPVRAIEEVEETTYPEQPSDMELQGELHLLDESFATYGFGTPGDMRIDRHIYDTLLRKSGLIHLEVRA